MVLRNIPVRLRFENGASNEVQPVPQEIAGGVHNAINPELFQTVSGKSRFTAEAEEL